MLFYSREEVECFTSHLIPELAANQLRLVNEPDKH